MKAIIIASIKGDILIIIIKIKKNSLENSRIIIIIIIRKTEKGETLKIHNNTIRFLIVESDQAKEQSRAQKIKPSKISYPKSSLTNKIKSSKSYRSSQSYKSRSKQKKNDQNSKIDPKHHSQNQNHHQNPINFRRFKLIQKFPRSKLLPRSELFTSRSKIRTFYLWKSGKKRIKRSEIQDQKSKF
jgi:hypothetical protein